MVLPVPQALLEVRAVKVQRVLLGHREQPDLQGQPVAKVRRARLARLAQLVRRDRPEQRR